jgi:hypothetical protein
LNYLFSHVLIISLDEEDEKSDLEEAYEAGRRDEEEAHDSDHSHHSDDDGGW